MPGLTRLREATRRDVRDPVWWTEVLQLVKTVVAAVIAWVLAAQVFGLPQAFLAPWAALLVVHATVYRTFSRGLRQVTGAVLGRAAGLGRRQPRRALHVGGLGRCSWSGLVVGSDALVPRREHRGRGDRADRADHRLQHPRPAAAGPALRHRDRHRGRARGQPGGVAAAARLLARPGPSTPSTTASASCCATWPTRCGRACTQEHVDRVGRPHPRPRRRHRPGLGAAAAGQGERPAQPPPRGPDASRRPTSSRRSCATTSRRSPSRAAWPARSAQHRARRRVGAGVPRPLAGAAAEAGEAIGVPDSARVIQVRARPRPRSPRTSAREDLSARHWPEYGALIMNLRNVVTSMDRVAAAEPGRAAPLREARPAAPTAAAVRG